MRPSLAAVVITSLVMCCEAGAQSDTASRSATFLNRRDLLPVGLALGGTVVISHFDTRIARWSQQPAFQTDSRRRISTDISKVNETSLTILGLASYGVGRLTHAKTATDIALHATEAVVLASVASQVIRGPLGRTRPYVTHDSDQYKFKPFGGFFGDTTFNNRAFPSIHTSSSMAVATVLVLETNRRHPDATPFLAPLLYAAAALPGLARIHLDQHWASDIASGAFMGVFAGYKVVSYSHDHPDNRFDRILLRATVAPSPNGGMLLGLGF